MIVYLVKMTTCALLLYAIYVLLIEKEKMHYFKRIYLLASLVFSLTVPLVVLTLNIGFPQMPATITGWNTIVEVTDTRPVINETNTYADYLLPILSVYVLIASFFLFRLLKNSWKMLAQGRKNACKDFYGAKIVLVDEESVPYSFGFYIFINRDEYNNGQIPCEIMLHERTHVRQRHTYDILFIELLIAFSWFNPVFYLYRNKIRQNHEFLADDAVIERDRELIPLYQTLLINHIPQQKNIYFTSNFHFNYLITKKRIIMMTKTTSKKWYGAKVLH